MWSTTDCASTVLDDWDEEHGVYDRDEVRLVASALFSAATWSCQLARHVPAERSRRKICALKVCCVDGLSIRLAPLAGNSTRGWHSGTNIHTTVVRYVVLMRRRSEYEGLNFNINGTLLTSRTSSFGFYSVTAHIYRHLHNIVAVHLSLEKGASV